MTIEIKKSVKPIKYKSAIDILEDRLEQIKVNKNKELIWILEHEEIYTGGTSFSDNEILDKSIKFIKTNRGGKITYHGPGQLVFYFVIDLNKRGKNIKKIITAIEKTIIDTLKIYNIKCFADRKNIGIWFEHKSGKIDIVIGTHALIQEKINFKNLGLAIIDEQHRFGVEHRKMLIKKSRNPNVLAMTATPIPRTLSMTLHGDMDISIIDELPKNRIPIITKIVNEDRLESIYEFIKKEMKEKRQCYIVFPIIEESESLDLEAAQTGYENIKNNIFQDYKIGYIHGKMKKDERDVQMDKFINGEINLLVSTTVIEVGIDNPNATVMIIENSERFGLTQLHQLRGRIGRGTQQSYCILVQRKNTPIANHRLKVMENTLNGFKISDEDLKLRGPGEFFGKRQHGYLKTKIADISKDIDIIKYARNLAFDIVQDDCELKNPEHKNIKNELIYRYSNMLEFIDIG